MHLSQMPLECGHSNPDLMMTSSPPPNERRAHHRLTLGTSAHLVFDSGETIEAECVDISVGGMLLRAKYAAAEGEVLIVEVPTPTCGPPRPSLVARVEVRRCHNIGPELYEIGGAIVEIIG